MPSPFPGMDPYLEQSTLWHQVHTALIVRLQLYLAPMLRPRYRVVVEQRTYLTLQEPVDLVSLPDVGVVETQSKVESRPAGAVVRNQATPLVAELPQPKERRERYLEVRDVATDAVITVIEILSPDNKRTGEGRRQYEQKRYQVLSSLTHLVEIDLLRGGDPMPMRIVGDGHDSAYRIVVSRAGRRPQADVYLFGIRDAIPAFPLPLRPGDEEPTVDVGQLLHDLYDQAGYDLAVDYTEPPPPPLLSDEDAAWLDQNLRDAGLRD